MASPSLIAFALSFVAGPLICALLLRLPHGIRTLLAIGLGVVISVTLALRLQMQAATASLVALWLAWVLAVAMVAMALRRRIEAPRPRRWVTVIAILATTLPWFGLATARLMV